MELLRNILINMKAYSRKTVKAEERIIYGKKTLYWPQPKYLYPLFFTECLCSVNRLKK